MTESKLREALAAVLPGNSDIATVTLYEHANCHDIYTNVERLYKFYGTRLRVYLLTPGNYVSMTGSQLHLDMDPVINNLAFGSKGGTSLADALKQNRQFLKYIVVAEPLSTQGTGDADKQSLDEKAASGENKPHWMLHAFRNPEYNTDDEGSPK
jgi:hypothetical protein